MNYFFTPEQMSLFHIAQTTWDRRGFAKFSGLNFGEESITETILMDLQLTFPGNVSIIQFNKNQEADNGADWAWMLSSNDGNTNLPMLVQAKLLDLKDHEYPEIKRNIGKKVPPIRQIDQLIWIAEKWGWPAIYAFYNNISDVTRIPNVCQSLMKYSSGKMHKSWGISLADAYLVRESLNDQTFDTHRAHSMPLHCLLCSGGLGIRPKGGSPILARASLESLSRSRGEDLRSSFRVPQTFEEPPPLFERALSIVRDNDAERRARHLEELGREFNYLAGVVIVRDADSS